MTKTTMNGQSTHLKQSHLEPQLKMTSVKQKKGDKYEQLACDFLLEYGLTLIAKNWLKAKVGEIDLIMLEKGNTWSTLVFVEVRSRKASINGYDYSDAVGSITKGKQAKLIKTAKYFLQYHPEYKDHECRFDVIGYTTNDGCYHHNGMNKPEQPEWIQGAFITTAW